MIKTNWQPIIGLEIHVELNLKSKMFCGCSANHFGKKANTNVCPVCLGLPGALPVPNFKAVESSLMVGLALGCQPAVFSKFDRKNYFYPDLPKGYQISQYDLPFSAGGSLEIDGQKIGITRVHLEEDTAKLSHQGNTSLIDFNRSGVPLVEIVTEPEIHSSQQAKAFLKELRDKLRYLKISDCDMEKGSMRLEVNISLSQSRCLPDYKVEIKNLNSFRYVERAIEFEINRQRQILVSGKKPAQETRGWNSKKQLTFSQRQKEEAKDYRYFPEPDIPPFDFSQAGGIDLAAIKAKLPESPAEKRQRYQRQFDLRPDQAKLLAGNIKLAEYFEIAASLGQQKGVEIKALANAIINKKIDWQETTVEVLVKQLSAANRQPVLSSQLLSAAIEQVVKDNPKPVTDFKKGQSGAIEFLLGMVMKQTKGQANPNQVREELIKYLS